MKATRNLYYYIMSFISLAILSWAIADLLRLVLEQLLIQPVELLRINRIIAQPEFMPPYPRPVPAYNAFLIRYITILLTLPVFVIHWLKTTGGIFANKLTESSFEELNARKIYCQIILSLGMGIILLSLIFFLSEVIQKGGYGYFQGLSAPIAYGIITFVVIVYHLFVLFDCNHRLTTVSPSKLEGSGVKFCPLCGKGLKNEWTFCTGCGNKIV